MSRYVVQHTFAGGLTILLNDIGTTICHLVVNNETADWVTWV
jgi:hypothetical protein